MATSHREDQEIDCNSRLSACTAAIAAAFLVVALVGPYRLHWRTQPRAARQPSGRVTSYPVSVKRAGDGHTYEVSGGGAVTPVRMHVAEGEVSRERAESSFRERTAAAVPISGYDLTTTVDGVC